MNTSPNETRPVWVAAAYVDEGNCRLRGIVTEDPPPDRASRVLVFEGGRPTAWLDFPTIPSTREVLSAYSDAVAVESRGRRPIQSDLGELPSATVVVCTRERPEQLRRCLEHLVAAISPEEEILVVDNAPTTNRTAAVIAEFDAGPIKLRRLHEPAPGLSRARNAALRSAEGEVVLFVDDDTIPEIGWTKPLRRAFAADEAVALATGLVPPAELDTAGQQLFQDRLHWSEDLCPESYSYARRDELGPLFPFAIGRLGFQGANMAVRRRAMLEIGGFDEHLGAGTRSRGGEDLEMFVRVLRRGWSLARVPESVVWHVHAREFDDVRQKVFGYGSGLTAYLTAVMGQPRRRELIKSIGHGVRYAASERRGSHGAPMGERDLLVREVLGFAWGPVAYLSSRIGASGRAG